MLIGRHFRLRRQDTMWRGFVVSIETHHSEYTIRIIPRQLQIALGYSSWYRGCRNRPLIIPVNIGGLEITDNVIRWHSGRTHITFFPPPEPGLPCVDPTQLHSSGGTYLRRHL
jgi:hypothetical protein